MKTYNDVRREYDTFKSAGGTLDLPSFAKAMDEEEGQPLRQAAYTDAWYKRADAAIENVFEKTGLPEIGGYLGGKIGGGIDEFLGTNVASTIESVGRETPRMITESLATFPEVASVAGAPLAAATWANRARKIGQALGYGSAATRGYAQTDSPLGALVGAGQMYGANKLLLPASRGGVDVGGRAGVAVSKALDVGGEGTNLAQRVLEPLVRGGTDVGVATGLNEATRQAMMSVGPNAVGPLAEERNPFTEENIAANVAGAAFFTPQIVSGLRNPRRLSPVFMEQKGREIQARAQTEQEAIDNFRATLPPVDPDTKSRQDTLVAAFRLATDAAKQAVADGDMVLADRRYENALEIYDDLVSGRWPMERGEGIEKLKGDVDEMARMQGSPPPEWLTTFAGRVKETLDSYTTEYQRFASEKKQREDVLNLADKGAVARHEEWVRAQEKQRGQTWHEGARVGEVVDRLWKNGKLQPLTPEWLAAEVQADVDKGWSSETAERLARQKVSNIMADAIPQALEADAATRKAEVGAEEGAAQKRQLRTDVEYFNYVKAFSAFPDEIANVLALRGVEIDRTGTRVDPRNGRVVSAKPSWRKAVMRAAQSWNPDDHTVLLQMPRRSPIEKPTFERVPITQMFAKASDGVHYLWYPNETSRLAEGAKGTSKGIAETNIEALPTQRQQEGVGVDLDEEAFQRALTETASGYSHMEGGEAFGLAEEGTGAEVPGAETAAPVLPGMETPAPKLDIPRIESAMKELSDEQLWSLARDQFSMARNVKAEDKMKGLRGALTTALEGKLDDPSVRVFFQRTAPPPGGSLGTEPHKARVYNVFRKLMDSGAVARAKQGVRPLMQGNTSDFFFHGTDESNLTSILSSGLRTGTNLSSRLGEQQGGFKIVLAYSKNALRTQKKSYQNDFLVSQQNNAKPSAVFISRDEFAPIARRSSMDEISRRLDEYPEQVAFDVGGLASYLDESGKPERGYQQELKRLRDKNPAVPYAELAREYVTLSENGPVTERTVDQQVLELVEQLPTDLPVYSYSLDENGIPTGVKEIRKAQPLMRGAEANVIETGTLTNRPPSGHFVEDLARTTKDWVRRTLGRTGMSGTSLDFWTEAATALVRQYGMENMEFFRLPEKPAGLAGIKDGKGLLGLDVDSKVAAGDERRQAVALIQTLAHEMSHLDTFIADGLIPRPDAFTDERAQVLGHMRTFAAGLTPDERKAMLTVMREYVPKELQTQRVDKQGQPYGTNDPVEFVAEMNAHVMSMLLFDTPKGRERAKEFLDFAPRELSEFARNTFLTIGEITESMYKAVEGARKDVVTAGTDPFITTRGFEAIAYAARSMTPLRHADVALAQAQTALANMKAPEVITNAMWFPKEGSYFAEQASMPDRPSETTGMALQQGAAFLSGEPTSYQPGRTHRNLITRFLAPFRAKLWAYERDGNPVARELIDTVTSVEAGSHRLYSTIVGGFMKKNPDGSMNYAQDNPILRKISEQRTGPWRDLGLNRIMEWQQNHAAQQMFVRDPKTGEIVMNPALPDAAKAWETMKHRLSREDQEHAMVGSVLLNEMGQTAGGATLRAVAASHTHYMATLIQALNRKMPAVQVEQIAEKIHGAFLQNQPLLATGLLPPDQFAKIQSLLLGPALDGKEGLLKSYAELQNKFASRGGYATESLPHDWIVRYRNAAGEVRFDSRPEESQALALANQLRKAGNKIDGPVVNRRDLDTFSKLSDPDQLLTKVAEHENFVWEKFVTDMEKTQGAEVGKALREGYTPMEKALRDVAATGVGKFLTERRELVDRSKFDYLDAALAGAGRLSYAIAARGMKQRVERLLNDPAVRRDPEFRGMVNEHVTEMLRPQNTVLKDMKALTSGYYIGANLASVLANLSQSVSTLVPILDAFNNEQTYALRKETPTGYVQVSKTKSGGGPVKPWKQFLRAIGGATDMTLSSEWQKLAAETKTPRLKERPELWSEEQTVATLWQRQVEAGGFSHTVIDDLVYGTDQRLLTNAKFGRGDYGPVTKSSMFRSGLYLLNQFAMKPFRWVEHGNAKIAFLAGVRQAYEQGLRGDAAFSHANQVQGLATFGGGRANVSGLHTALSKGFTPGGAGIALALQQYGFGVVAMHAQFVKDAIQGSKTLSPAEKWRIRRVYGSALMTQVALSGALGLPLVGAVLTALEKIFGIPANQAVREGLASLSEDDETGATVAEIGMNGFVDYFSGLDASSRLGTSSILGTSSYRGFNWGDLFGPAGGILENGVRSLGYFAQNEPLQAATELAPLALKNALAMTDTTAKYGDQGFRDKAGNLLYTPTPGEATAYKLGIRPRGLSRRRQAQALIGTSNEILGSARDRELDTAARGLSQGDPSRAHRLAQDMMTSDPTANPHEVLRQVMDRAVGLQVERDLLASGLRVNEAERERIVKTFGEDVTPRRSEVDLQRLRMDLARALGDPTVAPTLESFRQAAMVDAMVRGNPDMPRSKALRLVEFLTSR